MSFGEEEFFEAFADAGMLDVAEYTDTSGTVHRAPVGFTRPDALMSNEMVQIAAYQIEYETAKLPGLSDGALIKLFGEQHAAAGTPYKVAGNPMKQGNAYFTIADLTRAK